MNPQRDNLPLSVRFGKWAGLFTGSIGWGLEQQILSTTIYTSCPVEIKSFASIVAAACAILALTGGLFSWHALRSLPHSAPDSDLRTHTDRFIALCSILMTIIGVIAIVFGTPAGWILRCER
jgi:hypothetical protein